MKAVKGMSWLKDNARYVVVIGLLVLALAAGFFIHWSLASVAVLKVQRDLMRDSLAAVQEERDALIMGISNQCQQFLTQQGMTVMPAPVVEEPDGEDPR